MKAHIGVDAKSGLTHSLVTTAANEHDLNQLGNLLHGEEQFVSADAGYQGAPGGAPVSHHQAAVRLRESQIQGAAEKR